MGALQELPVLQPAGRKEKEIVFFKKTVLKRMLKSAYTGAGLIVGQMESEDGVAGYYVSSGWWVIWFNAETFPKEAKAAIIELCGELPGLKVVFKAIKDYGNQYEIEQKEIFDVRAAFTKSNFEYRVTDIMMTGKYGDLRMLQAESTGKVQAVSEVFLDLIDTKHLDEDGGEIPPIGPYTLDENSPFLYWGTNHCYLMACVTTLGGDKEKAFWKTLESTEII